MSCKIHNVRFYNFEPRPVICLAHDSRQKKLSLARNDNSIEIWNIANAPFIESTIAGQPENSVEDMLWIDSRLFSCGLQGIIVEYDLYKLKIKSETHVTGGAAWCMDINHDESRLAVGTEDGHINLFFISEDSLIYEKILDKQKGRIMCIKWDLTDKFLYTGSADTVRVWNVSSGNVLHRMLTSRKEAKKQTIIWCLAVTSDNRIVSGDSRGILSIWDPKTGTLFDDYETHSAAILSICISEDKKTIYCAGVDPVIRSISKIANPKIGKKQWTKSIERRLHECDVRSLVEVDNKLYSAGVDGYLARSSYPPKILIKYPLMLQPPNVYICALSKSIMLRYQKHFELWKLGSIMKNGISTSQNGYHYKLDSKPVKLLSIGTQNEESMVTCAISSNSRTIVYSTNSHVKVFNFNVIDGQPELLKMTHDIPHNNIQKMSFSPDNKIFATATNDETGCTITLYTVSQESLRLSSSFKTTNEKIKNIGLMCFSPDNKYLVCSDKNCLIGIYDISGKPGHEYVNSWCLTNYDCPPTAMNIRSETNNLVIVHSDHKIFEYNIKKKRYTKFSRDVIDKLPSQWLARPFPITNITFDQSNENIIILHDATSVFIIDKSVESFESSSKIPRLENGVGSRDSSVSSNQGQHLFQVVKKYKHLVHFGKINDNELVAVEVDPISILKKNTPSLKRKYFRT